MVVPYKVYHPFRRGFFYKRGQVKRWELASWYRHVTGLRLVTGAVGLLRYLQESFLCSFKDPLPEEYDLAPPDPSLRA